MESYSSGMESSRIFARGHRSVEELFASGRTVLRIWVSPRLGGNHRDRLKFLAKSRGVAWEDAPDARLASLCGAPDHGGVVAECSLVSLLDLSGLLSLPEASRRVVFVLDGVENPRNLGLVARTLAATGAGPIVVPSQGSASPGAAYLEASAGFGHMVPMVRVPKLVDALDALKKDGYWVYGLDANAERSLFGHELAAKTVFVMGNESKGLRPTVRKAVDQILSIPMKEGVESLNVAVASALCAFEALRAGRLDAVSPKPGG